MVKYLPLKLEWRPDTNLAIHDRLREVLLSWNGTPYADGQQAKGVGVDCVRFLAGVLDELYGDTKIPDIRLPSDASLHNPLGARSAMRQFLKAYPHADVTGTSFVIPGDVLVTGPQDGGPGHAVIVGPDKNTLWEATSRMVAQTGWARISQEVVFRVYTLRQRSKWIS